MSEFKQGIFNILKKLGTSSLALALIYTLGHIIIAMSVVSVMMSLTRRLAASLQYSQSPECRHSHICA